MTKKRWFRRVFIALAAVIVPCCAGFGVYVSDYHHASDTAAAALSAGERKGASVAISEGDDVIAVGDESADYGLVFYPGGKVDPVAYVPLAQKLAERGMFCVIVKMPFNLAVFNIKAADTVISAYPRVSHWWVGGHSLGGAAAAMYAADNADKLEGVALLGAYASDDLSALGLKVEVVYGSNDGVVNREKLQACIDMVPSSDVLKIKGGNHAGFGDYGAQDGDGKASISNEDQQEQTAEAIAAAMTGAV